jgi:hypothetical protein
LNAQMRNADFTGSTMMSGVSSSADERRSIRSVESRFSHTDR